MSLQLILPDELPAGVSPEVLELALGSTQDELRADGEGQISLAFVDEAQARLINREQAGNDYATDVLSFDYFEGEGKQPKPEDVKGEIVICLPIAERQATEYGTDVSAEILLLFIHGLLHILGQDHATAPDKTSFQTRQGAIMDKLKVKARDIFHGHTDEF